MNTKIKQSFYKYLPRFSEIDFYIFAIILLVSLIFSETCNNLYFQTIILNKNWSLNFFSYILFGCLIGIPLGIGIYYTFNLNAIIPKKYLNISIILFSIYILILNLLCIFISIYNHNISTNIITEIIFIFFIIINFCKSFITLYLIRENKNVERDIFNPTNTHFFQIILVLLLVPILMVYQHEKI